MKKPKVTREEYRKQVADKFIALLENNDNIPWTKGWNNPNGKPTSGATGKPYAGLNFMNLSMIAYEQDFTDNRWYTYNAIKALNQKLLDAAKERGEEISWENQIHLEKGSKCARIYDSYPVRGEYDETTKDYKWERVSWQQYYDEIKDKPENVHYRWGGREFAVFNGDQILNLPKKEKNQDIQNGYSEELLCSLVVDDIADKMGVELKHNPLSDRAFYDVRDDKIILPPKNTFISEESYYATAIHELAHATGHDKRLARGFGGHHLDKEAYAEEELVAEMTSAMMGLYAKEEWIDSREMENHKAYIQSWIKAIREKPEALERAIRHAFEASDYLDERIDKELLKERAIALEDKMLEEAENAFYHLDDYDDYLDPTYEQLLKEEVKFKEELLDPKELEQDKGRER